MAWTGGHRIRCNARWLATPILLIGAAVVAFAVWLGDVPILQVAAGVAVLTGVAAVVLFDRELVLTRRENGAERAALAKEYVEMYAARLRERLQANAVPVPLLPEESAIAAAAAEAESGPPQVLESAEPSESTESTSTESTEVSEPVAVEPAESIESTESTEVEIVAESEPAAAETVEPAAEPAAEPEPVEASAETADSKQTEDDEADMWDAYDAPTVVDLIAYEVRARLAEDERKDKEAEAAKAAESSESDQQQVAAG